jgi:hypothetical protein
MRAEHDRCLVLLAQPLRVHGRFRRRVLVVKADDLELVLLAADLQAAASLISFAAISSPVRVLFP